MAACKVAVLPCSAILQEEVEYLISLENQLRTLQRRRDELADDLMGRRLAGSLTEPGPYTIEVVTKAAPGRREFRLVIR